MMQLVLSTCIILSNVLHKFLDFDVFEKFVVIPYYCIVPDISRFLHCDVLYLSPYSFFVQQRN